MTELAATALWAAVFVYAVWSTRQAAFAFLERRGSTEVRTELEALRKDLNNTTRVASSAALAAGLRDDNK